MRKPAATNDFLFHHELLFYRGEAETYPIFLQQFKRTDLLSGDNILHLTARGYDEYHPSKNYPPESVDAPNSDEKKTPLTLAAKKGFGTIFGILIQYRVDWTQGGGFEKTFLHAACQSLSPILDFLLRSHIIRYLERYDDNGMTPFHYACSTGNEVALQKFFLQHEPDLRTTDKNGENPLMSAVINSHYNVCTILLQLPHFKKTINDTNVNSESGRESLIRLRGTNKSARFRPYTRLQRRETEFTVFDMEKRWQEIDNVISQLKKHQIGKSPEQLAEELERQRLQMADVRKRKAEKLSRELENKQRQIKIQGMRTTLRQMEQVVNKQQSMMDCSRAILQRQVELLQFTIAEVKRQSALTREIDEEMKNILGKINILQQQ